MKLIIGYFTLIAVMLASLYVFANMQASAEADTEALPDPALQNTSSEAQPAPAGQSDIVAYAI